MGERIENEASRLARGPCLLDGRFGRRSSRGPEAFIRDGAQSVREAIEQTLDRADEAKGHIRSLRSLID